MREQMLQALRAHAQGKIEMHKMNVEVYLTNPAGIGEHPDVMEAIEKEIEAIAEYDDQLEVLDRYFSK